MKETQNPDPLEDLSKYLILEEVNLDIIKALNSKLEEYYVESLGTFPRDEE